MNSDFYKVRFKELGVVYSRVAVGAFRSRFSFSPICVKYFETLSSCITKAIDSDDMSDIAELVSSKYFVRSMLLSGICPYSHNRDINVVYLLLKDETKKSMICERLNFINYIINIYISQANKYNSTITIAI